MNKTLMIAAALLTMGVGSAFAGEDFPGRDVATTNQTAIAQQASGQHRLYPATTRTTTSVYSSFATPGFEQGGQQ